MFVLDTGEGLYDRSLTFMICIIYVNDLDRWLSALSDPTRREIVEILSGGPRTASELHRSFAIAGPAVSRHLRVLREAGLVEQKGLLSDKRVRVYVLAEQPIEAVSAWLTELTRGWQGQLDAFADYVALRRDEPAPAPGRRERPQTLTGRSG